VQIGNGDLVCSALGLCSASAINADAVDELIKRLPSLVKVCDISLYLALNKCTSAFWSKNFQFFFGWPSLFYCWQSLSLHCVKIAFSVCFLGVCQFATIGSAYFIVSVFSFLIFLWVITFH